MSLSGDDFVRHRRTSYLIIVLYFQHLVASWVIVPILFGSCHVVAMAPLATSRGKGDPVNRKITKRGVDHLSAGDRDVLVWDTEVVGFGIRCRPSGAKHYVLKMRAGGRQRWITIGRHGSPWTPDAARAEAMRLLGLKAGGQDPATERDRQRGVITVQELGTRFLESYVPEHCKVTTASEYRRAVELFINPALGRHRISEVLRADVAHFHHELRDRPYQANRALGVLSKMMNLAEEWGLRPDGSNPCRHVKKYRESRRERYLSKEELQRLGVALAEANASGAAGPFAIAAIGLLVLTGARLREILTLQWANVDLDNAVLRLPDSKTGAKLIYLNSAAIKLLRTMPRIESNGICDCWSQTGRSPR
jgi:Arm DNA-binding domain